MDAGYILSSGKMEVMGNTISVYAGEMALTREIMSTEHVTSPVIVTAVGETFSEIGAALVGETASDRMGNSVREDVSACGPFSVMGMTSVRALTS